MMRCSGKSRETRPETGTGFPFLSTISGFCSVGRYNKIFGALIRSSRFPSLNSFSPTFSIFHFIYSLLVSHLPSSSLLNSYASFTKLTNGLCSLSRFTITVSVGNQLSGQNWCWSSSPVEARKNISKTSQEIQKHQHGS